MASLQGQCAAFLLKINAANLEKNNRNHSQNSKKYKAATAKLGTLFDKKNPWTDKSRTETTEELNTLKQLLSEENQRDTSIKLAIKAIGDIESKMGVNKTSERGLPPGGAMSVQGRVATQNSPQNKQLGAGSSGKTTGQTDALKSKQKAASGPIENENFIAFLKELKLLITDEQEHFTEDVLNWCKNGKNTEAMQDLIENIIIQRSKKVKLDSELKRCQDRLGKLTAKENSGDSSKASEASKTTDKKAAESHKSAIEEKENLQLNQVFKSEISLLLDEVTNGSVDMTAFNKKSKKFREDKTLKELQQIRLQLADRFEKSSYMKSELEVLVNEVEKGEYENSSFTNRMKKLKDKSVELEPIGKMRDSLKKWETEIKQNKMFIASLKEHRNDGKFTKISVKGEKQWQEDMQSLTRDLQKLVDGANGKFYDKIKPEVEKLQKCVKSKSFDSAAAKWYTKLKDDKDAVMSSLGYIAEQNAVWASIEKQLNSLRDDIKTGNVNTDRSGNEGETDVVSSIRKRLSESSKTSKEITNKIRTLKEKLTPDEKAWSDVKVDEQWKSDLEAIEKKATSIEKERNDTTYAQVKAEVMQLKREINSASEKELSETNDKEVLQAIVEMKDQILKWKRQERDLESLRAMLETGNLGAVKPTDKRKEEMTSPSVLEIYYRFEIIHKELDDITGQISALRHEIQKEEKSAKKNVVDRKWQDDINEIRQIVQDKDESLKGIETIHKELDDITGQISALRHEIQKEEKSAKKNVVDRKWQDDINEIRQIVKDKDESLKGMQNSIQLADVLDELRVIEERLILTYKTEDMKMQNQNKGNITRSRPARNTKEMMRESLTVLVDRVDDVMNYFAKRTDRLYEENYELAQHNSNMKADILAIKNNMEKLGKEKADLVLRLSNIAIAQLTEINPNIADLSDPNRPTKLSEQYIEIYDNEWIEAYEAMNKGSDMNEKQICLELLNVLLKVESECREISKTQYEQICSRCTSPVGPGENGQLDSIHLSLINDLQKQTAKLSISSVQKKILKDNKVSMKSEVVKYQKKCVEICWYMSLQTPPLVLDKSLKEGQAFDSERYN